MVYCCIFCALKSVIQLELSIWPVLCCVLTFWSSLFWCIFRPPSRNYNDWLLCSSCWHLPAPPSISNIAFLPLPQHSARNLHPLQSLRRGAAIFAPHQGPHASVALRRRLGRAVPSKLIISVGERSERFHRVRALLAVGRVVLSNSSARRVTAAEANAMCYTGVNEESQERVCIGAAAMRWLWCCGRAVGSCERERGEREGDLQNSKR